MIIVLFLVVILFVVHVLGAIQATNIIAARIAEDNPPEGIFVPVGGGRLHLIERGPVADEGRLPVLLLHGATSNARDMAFGLGESLSKTRRVIAVDRPGHGWSDRPGGDLDASPARQMKLIMEALRQRGVERCVVVGHSLSGALAANAALDHADRVAGLVVLAGATHPWPGGIAWYYRLAAMPVLGRIFCHTIMTPIGSWGLKKSAEEAFLPLKGPPGYVNKTSAALVLRPREFRWNGQDVSVLKAFLEEQAPRYGAIDMPTAIIADPADHVVSATIHAQALARQVPGARLTLLEGVGHQIHYTARETVLAEIERVAGEAESRQAASPDVSGRAAE